MRRRALAARIVAGLFLAASAFAADVSKVGQLNKVDAGVRYDESGEPIPPSVGLPVHAPSRLGTDSRGGAGVYFERSMVPRGEVQLEIEHDSQVRIMREGDRVSYCYLDDGGMRVSGAMPVRTGNGKLAPQSAFVVRYQPSPRITEVVGIEGSVDARNARGGPSVDVHARQYTRIVEDAPPTAPRLLGDEEYERFLRPFAFIGSGRAESQSIGHPLLAGAAVPAPDRAPPGGRVAVGGEDFPDRSQEDPFEQPRSVVESTVLGIDF